MRNSLRSCCSRSTRPPRRPALQPRARLARTDSPVKCRKVPESPVLPGTVPRCARAIYGPTDTHPLSGGRPGSAGASVDRKTRLLGRVGGFGPHKLSPRCGTTELPLKEKASRPPAVGFFSGGGRAGPSLSYTSQSVPTSAQDRKLARGTCRKDVVSGAGSLRRMLGGVLRIDRPSPNLPVAVGVRDEGCRSRVKRCNRCPV